MPEDQPSRVDTLLLAEFDQAWQHYRHVENTRNQFLGFFFTISLGSAALAGPTLHGKTLQVPSRLLLDTGFLWTISIVAICIYVAVRRAGPVMAGYETIHWAIRERFYGNSEEGLALQREMSIRSNVAVSSVPSMISIERMSEVVILVFVALAIAGLVALDVQIGLRNGSAIQLALSSLAPAVTILFIAFVTKLRLGSSNPSSGETTV
jgi:hypothetical protein